MEQEIQTDNLSVQFVDGVKNIVKSNGENYSIRSNRDRFFFPSEWSIFFDVLKDSQKPLFKTLINTGARINEVLHIKVEDIDIDNKRIILRVTKVKARAGEKNSRPRIIPISTQFSLWLKKYIRDNNLQGKDTLGFLSKPAAHIGMKLALQRCGIKDWRMFSTHNIRKTFESWLMALGVDGLKLTAHLGHSMSVAAGHYLSPDIFSQEEKHQIRNIIGDLYLEVKK